MKLELKSNHPDYVKVHCWLRRKYGKANKCESKNCNGRSKSFHWALKHGFDYEKSRDNFIQLCQSCHKKYDMNDVTRNKMSESKKGSNHSLNKLSELDIENIRNRDIKHGDRRKIAKEYNVSESLIGKILNNKIWNHV